MANYKSLKTTINANVKRNGNQEITGQILNSVLTAMVDTLGTGYSFAGIATPSTNPGTPDAKVFYIANGKGSYINFGGLQVTEDEVVVLYWDSLWHKESTGIAREENLTNLEKEVATKQNALTDTDGGYGQRVAELEKEGIASQAKLSELESKVDEIIMNDVPFTFEGYIVNNQAGKVPGSFVGSSGRKSTDFTDVENADKIVAKLKQSFAVAALIAYYDADKVFISALAKEQQSNIEIVVNKSEFPSGTKYVRLCTQTSGAYPKYAHLYVPSVIEIINSQIDDTLTKQGKIADAKAVGDALREAGTLTEEMQGVFPVNTYGERYWAVCGDSITSANHAKNGVFLIDGISDDDPYCPIDGYANLNSYKRKNYAYYFAKEHTIKWANYGYGGTTLSHCPSIGHPVSQTIPFVDDRIENLKN